MNSRFSVLFQALSFSLAFIVPPCSHSGITTSEVNASASGYGLQPRPNSISVCFVGDALTNKLPTVQHISTIVRDHFESAANIRFTGFNKANNTFPTCSSPQSGTCNNNPCHFWYPEDIRIAIDGTKDGNGNPITRIIPATETECVDKGAGGSWGVSPWNVDKPGFRACQYNVFIGNDLDVSVSPSVIWVNHILHEVGHALGLHHEFFQAEYHNYHGPNGVICIESTKSIPAAAANPNGYVSLTSLDPESVMFYQDTSCGIDGNYSNTGLSALDRLTLHIFYPETERIAEYVGTTVVPVGKKVRLQASLDLRGARMDKVVSGLQWAIEGQESETPIFEASWESPSIKNGILTYNDFLGRKFSTSIHIRVLSHPDFTSLVSASASAQILLL